ncbi:MAG: hypothetical protein WB789_04895 [Thermoplasmata archaeon]
MIVAIVLFILAGGAEYLRTRRAERSGRALSVSLVSKLDRVHPLSEVLFRIEVSNLTRLTITVQVGYGDLSLERSADPSITSYADLLNSAAILLHPSNKDGNSFQLGGIDSQEIELRFKPKREGRARLGITITDARIRAKGYNLGPYLVEVSNKFTL